MNIIKYLSMVLVLCGSTSVFAEETAPTSQEAAPISEEAAPTSQETAPNKTEAPQRSAAVNAEVNPWTKCGIGAMLFDETPAAAVISNIIWDLGTTAVTSAGLSKETCEGKEVHAAYFIQETYATLEQETAKGSGQHLTAMLNIFGCENAVHGDMVNAIRSDFASAVRDSAYTGMSTETKAQQYYGIVANKVTGTYAASCQLI